MFDVSQLKAEPTHRVKLTKPGTREPIFDPKTNNPLEIVVYGPASKQYAEAQRKKNAWMVAALSQKDSSELDTREADARFLAHCTKSVNFAYNGVDLAGLSADQFENAMFQMYSDSSLGWIGEQLTRQMSDWANFMPKAQTD